MSAVIAQSTESKPASHQTIWSKIQRLIMKHPVWWFLGCLLVIRSAFILLSPVDLIADESYYWDWSRRLDYGYYSKPPMIAWINWLSCSIFGVNEFAVRFPAALLGTLGLVWVYQLGVKLFSFRVGMLAIILLALTPGQTAMSFLMTIDAPFLFFWAAVLYSFWMMTKDQKPNLFWCAMTALWLGLGLLSKQTMLGFLPLGGLFLLVTPSRRHLCLSPRVWGTAIAGLLFLIPVIYWNAQHDWIMFQHTAGHFQETSVSFSTRMARFSEFLLGQVGVVSPVLWFTVMATLVAAVRKFSKLNDAERYLLCFSGVPLAGIIILSATRRLEPNWPAACYPAGVIFSTAVLLGRSTLVDLFKNRTQLLSRTWKTGLAFSLVTYAAITVVPVSPLAGSPLDITCRLRGWRQLAARFEQIQQDNPVSNGIKKPLIISTAGRDLTSAFAFYLKDQPLIPLWTQDDAGIHCQYDMWDYPDLTQHSEIIVVTEVNPLLPESLKKSYSRWDSLGIISVELGGGRSRKYEVFRASDPPKLNSPSQLPIARQPQIKSTLLK